MWGVITIQQEGFDLAVPFPPAPPLPTTSANTVQFRKTCEIGGSPPP